MAGPGLPTYPDCPMAREPPELLSDAEIAEIMAKDFRLLPSFEKLLYENKYRKYYSLQTNKLLYCRWRSYLRNYEEREFAPFTFVDIRDFHFYSGMIRLLPEKSLHRTTKFPYKLGLGPGVDFQGQIPIPQDVMMKRGMPKPKAERKIHRKDPKKGANENEDKKKENKK